MALRSHWPLKYAGTRARATCNRNIPSAVRDFQRWMNEQLCEIPWVYGLITEASLAPCGTSGTAPPTSSAQLGRSCVRHPHDGCNALDVRASAIEPLVGPPELCRCPELPRGGAGREGQGPWVATPRVGKRSGYDRARAGDSDLGDRVDPSCTRCLLDRPGSPPLAPGT